MATGEVIAAIAMTEPGTGSDLQSIATKADPKGLGAESVSLILVETTREARRADQKVHHP